MAAVAALALATAATVFGGVARTAPPAAWQTFTSAGDEFTVRLPDDWHRASRPLVPQLLNPGEILSSGTGPLPVGAGGNCRRYPAAALVRMGSGDRLISIQGSAQPAGPRPRWFRRLDRWPRRIRLPRQERFVISDNASGPTRRLWTNVLSLRRGGRYYWVFIAFGDPPSHATRDEVERILGTLRLEPRDPAA